jgi:molecular chaperone DnaK
MAKAIGIDLGTTNSVAAHKVTDARVLQNRENDDLTPSAVCPYKGELIVGKKALDRMAAAPQDTIISVKRLMGRAFADPDVQRSKGRYQYQVVAPSDGTEDDVRVVMGGKEYSPIEISALILKKIKADAELRLNDKVEYAVITVPAYFTEKQKHATRKAGQLAGLRVQQILDEPTAAAIAFGMDNVGPDEARIVLVFDLGGGTFDVSLLQLGGGVFAQVNIEGDMWLGGDDFDHKIMDYVVQEIKKQHGLDPTGDARFMAELKRKAEQAKKELSTVTRTDILLERLLQDAKGNFIEFEIELTRERFERMIQPDLERSLRLVETALERVKYRPEDIDHVLLVGGSSTIPMFRRALVEKFGEQKILMNVDPMKCVAYGAGILAARIGFQWQCSGGHLNSDEVPACAVCGELAGQAPEPAGGQILFPITPTGLGIQTEGDKFEIIIPKGSTYPTPEPVVQEFFTPQANLRRIRVPVYQGEKPKASENELQVTVWLELPANLPEKTPVDVAFRLNKDGILDQVWVALKDGSGRRVEVYPDRGGERRSRLEKRMEQLRHEWAEKRFMLDRDIDHRVEQLYNEAAEAANRQDTADFEQRLREMEQQLSPKPEWVLKAEALLSNSEVAIDEFDWLIGDPQKTYRLKKLSEELKAACQRGDQAQGESKFDELKKAIDDLPYVVRVLLILGQAAYKASREQDIVTADRITAGLRACVDALRTPDMDTVNRILSDLAPIVNKVLGEKVVGPVAERLLVTGKE